MKPASTIKHNILGKLSGEVRRRAARVVKQTALFVEGRAKGLMEGPKSGRTYRRAAIKKSYKVGSKAFRAWKGSGARFRFSGGRATTVIGYKFHRASAPGESPAVDMGLLRESIQAQMTGELSAIVFTNQAYAPVLEFGGAHILPRPFMKPAGKDGQSFFTAKMINEIGGMK